MPVLRLVALLVQIPIELRTRLRVAAARSGRTMSAIVIDALESFLNEQHKVDDRA